MTARLPEDKEGEGTTRLPGADRAACPLRRPVGLLFDRGHERVTARSPPGPLRSSQDRACVDGYYLDPILSAVNQSVGFQNAAHAGDQRRSAAPTGQP